MGKKRERRAALRGRDEMAGLFTTCIAVAMLAKYFLPGVLSGGLAWILLAGAVAASVLTVVFTRKGGGSIGSAFGLLLLGGTLAVGTMYGTYWYFMVHLMSQPNVFLFAPIGQPTVVASAHVGRSAPIPTATPEALGVTVTMQPVGLSPDKTMLAIPSVTPNGNACGKAVVREVDMLAIRSQPTRSSAQVGAIPQGGMVDLACEPAVIADDRTWRKVRRGAIEGWMSTRYLTINNQ